jgi:hypothetical protein
MLIAVPPHSVPSYLVSWYIVAFATKAIESATTTFMVPDAGMQMGSSRSEAVQKALRFEHT